MFFYMRHEPGKENTRLYKNSDLRPVRRLRQIPGIYDLQLFQYFFHPHHKMGQTLLRSNVLL